MVNRLKVKFMILIVNTKKNIKVLLLQKTWLFDKIFLNKNSNQIGVN